MSFEFLYSLAPGLVVTLLLVGIYKSLFEKQENAKEHINALLSDKPSAPTSGGLFGKRADGDLLKKRKKKKGEEQTFIDRLETDLERANLMVSTTEFLMISAATGATLCILMLLGGQHFMLALLVGVAAIFLPMLMLKVKIMLRLKRAASEFADVLDSMVNGFKTGYGFSRSVQMVSDNFKDPWGTEFGKMAAEINLGLNQEEALFNLSKRIPSADVDLFVTAILIQKDTGGNMSELLATLSKTCRDRYKLFQKVGAISAQGKLSAGIICCVPFGLSGFMFLMMPEAFGKFIGNPIGLILLIITGIWMCCGVAVLFKIVQIEV